MSTLLTHLAGATSIVALTLVAALVPNAYAEGGFPPGKGAPFARDDFPETLPNGELILRVKISGKLDGQVYVLSAADLKGCIELVVPVAKKIPRYTPFLWDTEAAYQWTGRCTRGLRDGAGELTAVDTESGEMTVSKGVYGNGQRDGVWETTTGDTVRQETYGTSEIPPKIATAIAAVMPRLIPQPIFTERYEQARKHLAAAAKPAPVAAPSANSASNTKAVSGSPTAACQSTMAFMENRIPNFSAPELRQIRQAILAEDVRVALSKAKAQGFTTQGAIKAALDQAKEFDRVSRESAQCAADVDALGATDESFLASMRQGRAPTTCSGIRNSCLCAGVLNRMSAVGSRALAAEMQCFARSGQPDATVADEQAVRQAAEEERQRRAAMPAKPVTTPASNQATCPAGLVRLPWGCRDPKENPFGDPNRR